MRVIITGGDGFVGWPTALKLSRDGHEVCIVDNLSRRRIGDEVGASSVVGIASLEQRVDTWFEQTGRRIDTEIMDLNSGHAPFAELLRAYKPTTVCHFAHQRSAPYSMLSHDTQAYTLHNNLATTQNMLLGVLAVDPTIHIVHMGTMGVYGYGDQRGDVLPEGYLTVYNAQGTPREIVHPYHPGSVYHMTKCMINLMFHFYVKNNKLRITELHQGIIWGTQTPDTALHPLLSNRVDVDGEYGTVLNRFALQAAQGQPLSIYGTGEQTRAFIHITDSTRCTALAVSHPPEPGARVETFNQTTQTMRLLDLAAMLQSSCECQLAFVPNPRKEAAGNELRVTGTVDLPGKFAELELSGQTLITPDALAELVQQLRTANIDGIRLTSQAVW
jgi:UDP-sulfoquinovose synthase